MSIQRIGVGPRMSKAVVHGNTVYLAGQVADKAAGKSVGEQTADILGIIDGLLAEAGTDKSRLLTATIWLADMADFGAMNVVWEEWIGGANAPTRATGEVRLATPDYKVEVIVTAALA